MEEYKSEIGRRFEKKFKKLSPSSQLSALSTYGKLSEKYGSEHDSRNPALKELDKPWDEVTKEFSRKKGTFDPKEEMKKETELEKDIEKGELPEESKKKYLHILKQRMRTA